MKIICFEINLNSEINLSQKKIFTHIYFIKNNIFKTEHNYLQECFRGAFHPSVFAITPKLLNRSF